MSLLSVFLILLSFQQGTSTTASGATEQSVTEVEQRYTAALLKKDAVAFDELLAADLLHISFDGQVANKAQYMAFFKEGPWQYRKYEPTNGAIKVLRNVAVVTGQVNRTIVINNNETTGVFAFTHVWARTADRWHLTSSQVTAVPIAPSMG